MQALRFSGVEDALARGHDLDGMGPQEAGELGALRDEIECRLAALQRELERACHGNEVLGRSRLVSELLRLSRSVQEAPEAASPP
jgi:hypothetical protein